MNDIETLNCMGKQNKEIYLFPLDNINKIDIRPTRSVMEMIIDSGVAKKIQDGKIVGAFIVANKKQFYEIKNRGVLDNKELEEATKHLELHSEYNGIVDKGQCIRIPEKNFTKTKEAIETVLKELERLQEDYISKDKIREEIAEHRNYLLNQAITSNPALDAHFRDKENYVIKILKELLEGK